MNKILARLLRAKDVPHDDRLRANQFQQSSALSFFCLYLGLVVTGTRSVEVDDR